LISKDTNKKRKSQKAKKPKKRPEKMLPPYQILSIVNGRPARDSLSTLVGSDVRAQLASFRRVEAGVYEADIVYPAGDRMVALAERTNRSGVVYTVTIEHLSPVKKRFLVRYQGILSDRNFQVTWVPELPKESNERQDERPTLP
jgi:hypothetical protein